MSAEALAIKTIGYGGKSARDFFGELAAAAPARVVDVRLRPNGQMSGWAKASELPYFLRELAGVEKYTVMPALAPTPEMLNRYRRSGDWDAYALEYSHILRLREVGDDPKIRELVGGEGGAVLLCSEKSPARCHRRLAAEHLAERWRLPSWDSVFGGRDTEVVHL